MPIKSLTQPCHSINLCVQSDRRLRLFNSGLRMQKISFSNQKELTTKLTYALKNFKLNESWFKKDTKLNLHIVNTIKSQNKRLPNYVASSISKLANQNKFITAVHIDNSLFTQKEREEIVHVGITRQKEKARRESRMNYFFFLGAGNALISTIGLGLAFPVIATKVVGGMLVSALFGFIRQKYLDFCASYYSPHTKIKNSSERLAFEYGTQSMSMLEWLKSFFSLSAILHPIAFAAGLEHALEKNEDIIAHVLEKPLARDKLFTMRVQIRRSAIKNDASNLQVKWIHFDHGQDLQMQLQNLVNEYKKGFTFIPRSAKLKFSQEESMHLPSYVPRYIQEVILDNQCIQDVTFQPTRNKNMFTINEIKEIKTDCRHNTSEQNRRLKSLVLSVGLAAGIGIFFNAIIPFALLGGLFHFGRQFYLDKVVRPYNTKTKIARVHNNTERKALLYGRQAGRSYKELFFSWGCKETYTHFNAFEAGKELTIEGNKAFLKNMKRLKF